jgi:hypothetical protein
MKCRYIGGKYMHFITARRSQHTLRALLVPEQKK